MLIEHLRSRKGGWQVTFLCDSTGEPSIRVSQPRLSISNVMFVFPGQSCELTNTATSISFDRPISNVPFGRVLYLDTTFLPGSVVFDLFGNEVELLPRVLVLNKREIPWQSDVTFELAERSGPGRSPARTPGHQPPPQWEPADQPQ
jgi:hypothetical protein